MYYQPPIHIMHFLPFAVPAAVLGIFAAMGFFLILIGVGVYVVYALAFYRMFQKANLENPWLAFIPIANLWPFMWTIKKSAWNILFLLIPIANFVFYIIWQGRLLKAFGMNQLFLLIWLGVLVPGAGSLVSIAFLVLYAYMGFNDNIQYNPNFDL